MSFHDQLKRLRDAAENRQEGVHPDKAYVKRQDLRELIFHFDRLDGELRRNYANCNYWEAKAEGEKLAREALQEELEQEDCWISVDDRLPSIEIEVNKTNMQIVNVVTSRGYVTTAKYSSEGYNKTQRGRKPKWRELDGSLFFGEITHWMPLPVSPKVV